ncbi:cupin domain-containing protein [Parahaliea sp. F7430]|uniref:Cupin domain-containing protein n=1 Tax=Sediminihaliea albiluteola TaxID=2758564 RepID=A0A7W2YKL5_9GAMM|nr:cupin domain-containing protein [Sediminihaliea albiluteola]MBA6413493.1 cupin domain-containing protein [Sediminihaliea albiluteola]
MNNKYQAIHGDLSKRVVVDTQAMSWSPSPANKVWRKRLHQVGPGESGQVTSIVRYEPGARFHKHDHPEGEEILVLEGVFSDEQGDWPAGSYLLNPEGFCHAPWSETGCTLFVKLRQFPGHDRERVAIQTRDQAWQSSVRRSVQWQKLYAQDPYTDFMRLEAWDSPDEMGQINFPQGAEVLVIKGSFSDENGHYGTHSWLRIPAGGLLNPISDDYCEVYIKEGGFSYLREALDTVSAEAAAE